MNHTPHRAEGHTPSIPKVLYLWNRLSRVPFGKWIFAKLIGLTVPYAASLSARVTRLEPGIANVLLNDRRAVRNHLKSIHAAALAHLAELAANLALMSLQPEQGRWIVTGMDVVFKKKARGPITAAVSIGDVDWSRAGDLSGRAELLDGSGNVVATVTQHWRVGPSS